MSDKRISCALISVYYKEGLSEIAGELKKAGVKIFSTGGTFGFLRELDIPVDPVENLTSYPSILGGRVKTLHPAVFGGILARRDNGGDRDQLKQYSIPEIDLVIVDLYPFSETVASSTDEQAIIEKIDIGGISLIRAGAKNYKDVLIVSSRKQYEQLLKILREENCVTSVETRRRFAAEAFVTSSGYDSEIFNYFNRAENLNVFRSAIDKSQPLRYGENPHQKGFYFGDLDALFDKLHGKELSYNNLLDTDAAINLIDDFAEPTCAIIKHNNACGIASRNNVETAWKDALACDPVSAYGGVISVNMEIDEKAAAEIDKIFFEIIVAPSYTEKALSILVQKKNRIILKRKSKEKNSIVFRSVLNGVLVQDQDSSVETPAMMTPVTRMVPTEKEYDDLVFANKIVKHSKSNAIVLVRNRQLCASGIGQTSRVDAMRQAIEKAGTFGFDLRGAVLASDAFFPFADSLELASKAGITAVVQPGGSVRDNESIDFCNTNNISMVFTGIRHFKH